MPKIVDVIWTGILFILTLLVFIHDTLVVTDSPRKKLLSGYHSSIISIIIVVSIIVFLITIIQILSDKNTFMNLLLLLLSFTVIVWYSYLLDRIRKNKKPDSFVLGVTFTIDTLIFIGSSILLYDALELHTKTGLLEKFKKLF